MSSRAEVNAAVKEAYDAGLCVVPPKEDGSKAPDGRWKDFQRERPTLDQLRELYRQERHGLGVVGGTVSGELEVLEFEDEKTYHLFKEHAGLAGLEDLVARIEEGYLERAPRGGYHWLWRTDKAGANTKLAMSESYETLIETRGSGGFCITAPSYGPVHPSGKPYVRLCGSFQSIPQVDILEERQPLLDVAKSLCRAPKLETGVRVWDVREAKGDRPGDDFDARGNWAAEVLKPAGWVLVAEWGDQQYWRRPEKDDGHSAVLHTDSNVFVPFSSSTPFPVTQVGYGKFSSYAILHHGGDWSAAASELKRRGYGKEKTLWTPPEHGRIVRADQLGEMEMPPIETLPVLGRQGFFMARHSNLFYGPPKAGKTDFTLALVGEWLREGRRVTYFTEEDLSAWKDRLSGLGRPWADWEPLLLAEAMGWGLEKVLKNFTADDIVIVDTLRSTAGFREGEGDKDVSRVIEPLILASRQHGATLICSYHARKMPGEDGTDISGHHSLFGAFDRAIQLKKVSGEDNDRKRRLTVMGRLLDPKLPRHLIYEMTGPCQFRPCDKQELVEEVLSKRCEQCRERFTATRVDARFCTDLCRQRAKKGKGDSDRGDPD